MSSGKGNFVASALAIALSLPAMVQAKDVKFGELVARVVALEQQVADLEAKLAAVSVNADGDLVTGAASLDSEISKDGGTFADVTAEATEIATNSGMYYLDLAGGAAKRLAGSAIHAQRLFGRIHHQVRTLIPSLLPLVVP